MASTLKVLARQKMFGGFITRYSHYSEATQCTMGFSIMSPPSAKPTPAVYFLSGLTCDDTNFTVKAGAQKYLAEHSLSIVCPDTSPRGCNLPNDKASYDFGEGAGFYLNATMEPYKKHYNMFQYITEELPQFIERNFPIAGDRRGIMGHSMGGLGALNCFAKTRMTSHSEGLYDSVSAFAPICNPTSCPWGEKAFTGYLGPERRTWEDWDPSLLLRKMDPSKSPSILITQGTEDKFLKDQLKPETLPVHPSVKLEYQEGYDHSYYFIATFIEQHIRHHAHYLCK